MKLSQILFYPLKSARGIKIDQSLVARQGLKYDRIFAIVDERRKVLTAREYPQLLGITLEIKNDGVLFGLEGVFFQFDFSMEYSKIEIFGSIVYGVDLGENFAEWISNLLGIKARVFFLKENSRIIKEKYNSQGNDVVSLADISPIHLISKSSLEDLNGRLSINDKVFTSNFRPNLVVENPVPYEEDNWKQIQINNCVFDVHYKATRCILSTIDSKFFEKNKNSEPLRTLSKYRKNSKGEVCFGVYLIPKKTGVIDQGDTVKVLK